ncbi:hypothetical protein COEREDRAFT_79739 [Coemansia reversa NRRL 1564]|uniref:RING-type E3 ubiquitin transferase n=1 Tax=Coemansia reversa (strain ATCC 12441 / NRRL 1564) TaxID=763665 RepID=A0A2G5BID0_COERN|nr:hypothetical protein COEREDRAFT_79739 [Coemansia reversa NRRL 1564]|eukprot:PIA18753.1 hypothetical protein COEREDRAFT_79739 [Coemansia reversa NRRL 1564]
MPPSEPVPRQTCGSATIPTPSPVAEIDSSVKEQEQRASSQHKGKQRTRGRKGGVRGEKEGIVNSIDKGDNGTNENEPVCLICADTVDFYSVGECDHRICFRCNLRLRALFKSKACPYCKIEQTKVIYTREANSTFSELAKRDFPFSDEDLGIQFDCKEAYEVTSHALQLNCPHRKCRHIANDGWKGLKDHARSSHALQFCDLCLNNKMSFAHEHRLFTKSQLRSHNLRGDTTGFTGHPECEFCRLSFYDNDQLLDHCRKKHEQCFICVRNGTGRQVYYANYQSMEDHFKSDHFSCKHPSCLEKKFVVFENEIDLQSHDLEEHSGNIIGQRARREAKQISVGLHYTPLRGSSGASGSSGNNGHSKDRGRSRGGSHRPNTMTVNEPDATGVSIAGRRRPTNFGRVSTNEPRRPLAKTNQSDVVSTPEPSSPEPEAETDSTPTPVALWPTLGATLRNSGDRHVASSAGGVIRDRAPGGFEQLSVSESSATERAAPKEIGSETMAQHQELLQRVSAYLSHREQPVERFRQLTTRYKDHAMPAEEYVQSCWLLFLTVPGKNAKVMIQKTMRAVSDLLPDSRLQDRLLKALQRHRVEQQQFPALTPLTNSRTDAGSAAEPAAHVMIIKPSSNSAASRNTWSGSSLTSSSSRFTAPKDSKPSTSAQQPRVTPSASPLPAAAFPSLGSNSGNLAGSCPTKLSYANAQANGRGHGSYSAKFTQASSSMTSQPSTGKSVASEFPDLPPTSKATRKVVPLDPNATSAWEGAGLRVSSLTSDASNSKRGNKKKQGHNSKGKQILYIS